MCDLQGPCPCTLERRAKLRDEHIARSDALRRLAHRLSMNRQISESEALLLYHQAGHEWDDAIHIASTDDPLRSLCGLRGRNLVDLPERPDPWGGCWTCLWRSEPSAEKAEREMTHV